MSGAIAILLQNYMWVHVGERKNKAAGLAEAWGRQVGGEAEGCFKASLSLWLARFWAGGKVKPGLPHIAKKY